MKSTIEPHSTRQTTRLVFGVRGKDAWHPPPPPLDHLICLQSMHQQFHFYITFHDFMSEVENGIPDHPSCSWYLNNTSLISYMNMTYPQRLPSQLWTQPIALVSVIASALRWTTFLSAFLLIEPSPPMGTGPSGLNSSGTYSSTPY